MSEFHFGTGRGKVDAAKADEINAIAQRHGAHFVAADMPEGPRYWFSCPNEGEPFDRATRNAVFADLEAEGLADSGSLVLDDEIEGEGGDYDNE